MKRLLTTLVVLTGLFDADGERVHKAPSYASRSPGTMHGPVRSEGGCLILEFNWYDSEK